MEKNEILEKIKNKQKLTRDEIEFFVLGYLHN